MSDYILLIRGGYEVTATFTPEEMQQAADAYTRYPALLRLIELDTLRDLAHNAAARLYINFDRDGAKQDKED